MELEKLTTELTFGHILLHAKRTLDWSWDRFADEISDRLPAGSEVNADQIRRLAMPNPNAGLPPRQKLEAICEAIEVKPLEIFRRLYLA